jgi:hypothetical protein
VTKHFLDIDWPLGAVATWDVLCQVAWTGSQIGVAAMCGSAEASCTGTLLVSMSAVIKSSGSCCNRAVVLLAVLHEAGNGAIPSAAGACWQPVINIAIQSAARCVFISLCAGLRRCRLHVEFVVLLLIVSECRDGRL